MEDNKKWYQKSLADIFGFSKPEVKPLNRPVIAKQSNARSSSHPKSVSPLKNLNSTFSFVDPSFNFEAIPLIRKLRTHNPDVGLVINDLKELTNTGHDISFSADTPPAQAEAMINHLKESSRTWADGIANIDGLINKMISQIWIGGALSVEFIPSRDMKKIQTAALVNPEEIRFQLNRSTRRYEPYQEGYFTGKMKRIAKKLNTKQYVYYGINGDEEIPYGIPPFITALEAIEVQKDMKENISFIIDQVGVMGFLEFLMAKPHQDPGESNEAYKARLEQTLTELRSNIKNGFKEGMVVGYLEDHEATFHSTTQNISGLDNIFNLNETQVANGLKTTPSFLGISSGTTESYMSIVFTKMLSQLRNVQNIISSVLEFGYKFDLRLAGFNPKYINTLKVNFKPSTITDDLKTQQAGEIKRRNLKADYDQGLISQKTFADLLGYEKPDQKEPRQTVVPGMGIDPVKKEKRETDKDDSDRRSRDRKKDQPKRKDDRTKNP